jgi:hypothetical protein
MVLACCIEIGYLAETLFVCKPYLCGTTNIGYRILLRYNHKKYFYLTLTYNLAQYRSFHIKFRKINQNHFTFNELSKIMLSYHFEFSI